MRLFTLAFGCVTTRGVSCDQELRWGACHLRRDEGGSRRLVLVYLDLVLWRVGLGVELHKEGDHHDHVAQVGLMFVSGPKACHIKS